MIFPSLKKNHLRDGKDMEKFVQFAFYFEAPIFRVFKTRPFILDCISYEPHNSIVKVNRYIALEEI